MDGQPIDEALVERLVRSAAAGDAAAFGAIYDAYAPRVRRFLRRQTGDPDLAEELLQRTFVKMIEALPRYRQRGLPFGAWVFRVARNTVIDYRRTSHPAVSLDLAAGLAESRPGDAGDPVSAAERHDDRARLRMALDTLPPDQQEVLVWRFFADLAPAETAAIMGRSNGAIRVLQHRALTSLRRHFGRPDAAREPAPAPIGGEVP